MIQEDGVSAFLTAYDLAERTERNEPEHHGAGETFAKAMRIPGKAKSLNSLSDKEAKEPGCLKTATRHGVSSVLGHT